MRHKLAPAVALSATLAAAAGCHLAIPTTSGPAAAGDGLFDLDAAARQEHWAWEARLPLSAVLPPAEIGLPEEGSRFIVKTRDEGAGRAVQSIVPAAQASDIAALGLKVVVVPKDLDAERILDALRGTPGVEYAEPDHKSKAFDFAPDDTYYANQWGLRTIASPLAWDTARSSADIKIAVLDTGIDAAHPDLKAKVVAAKNFSSSRKTEDVYGHGTHVAGIAAASTHNAAGIAGVAIHALLLNVKVLGDNGSGSYSGIINGVVWAADNGAKVINLSLGATSPSTALADAIAYAVSKGVVVVAAAGNGGSSAPSYPAYVPGCIAVAATGQADTKTSWSSYGDWVDVAAPGDKIFSTMPTKANRLGAKNYGYLSGTSMAAPFVAGAAAVLAAIPASASVRDRLESTCDPIVGTGTFFAKGRLNLAKAVAYSGSTAPGASPAPTPAYTLAPSPASSSAPAFTPSPMPTARPSPMPPGKPIPKPPPTAKPIPKPAPTAKPSPKPVPTARPTPRPKQTAKPKP